MSDEQKKKTIAEREEEVLKFWEEKQIFRKSVEKNKKGKSFTFYEGPPTANGRPGIHHVEGRAFKDIIPRYKTMRGFHVPRKAGWDTHGLPVEIQVEKELGLKNKQDIETYGIAAFNAKAKESVWKYKEEWERLTKRMGFWIDLERPYITYDTGYIETLWWIIKEFWKKGLLEQDYKVMPWCTRCATGLSSHELAQGYKKTADRSVYVKFQIDNDRGVGREKIRTLSPEGRPLYILAWTTTPWTLPGNVGLAVHPDLDYVVAADGSRGIIVARSLAEKVFKTQAEIRATVKGRDLLGIPYIPLFDVPELKKSDAAYKIYPADFVSADDGTGVVHTAVMYGEDDFKLGKKVGLPTVHTVDESGKFISSLGDGLAGLYVKDPKTEEKIIQALTDKNLLFREEKYEHDYPFCWRCGTPLLYYARRGWWVRTTAVKKELLANNEGINWVPEHLKKGRFGEFLKDVRDWAFSRERYWGTPLPIWKCDRDEAHTEVIASREELAARGPKPKNRYIVMRHGQSGTNVKKIVARDGAYPLTSAGRTQAAAAARKLKKEKIGIIIASPVRRAQETARIVADRLGIADIYTEPRFAEIDFGDFEGRRIPEWNALFSSLGEKFEKPSPGGESFRDVRKRMLAGLAELERAYAGKTILIVSHHDPLWLLATSASGLGEGEAVVIHERAGATVFKFADAQHVAYRSLPRDESGEVNLHRPYVDSFTFECKMCGGAMRRVPEVADVWFDSGAMPFAQDHWPFAKNQESGIRNQGLSYPADYISEGVDQTRGWFYTLLVVATLLGKGAPYRNVISVGILLDKNGQKMSKSKGNVVDPWELIPKYGIDALRWYMYTINQPGDEKRFDERDLGNKYRGFIQTFWNCFVLFDTYVEKVKIQNSKGKSLSVLDTWVLARTEQLTAEVTDALERYDITAAGRAIEDFVITDFSQWYLRRSRRRFQRPESKKEFDTVASVTAYVLLRLAVLSAPFVPFLAEAVFQGLKKKGKFKEESVHLLSWPKPKKIGKKETGLIGQMARVREAASAALKLRADAGIKVRQPIASVPAQGIGKELEHLFLEEVNAKKIGPFDPVITPELKEEGIAREIIRNIQEMRRELGLKPKDRIRVYLPASAIGEKWRGEIARETGIKGFLPDDNDDLPARRKLILDGTSVHIVIDTTA